ncbi:hypothetical protein LCGC14_1520450 [marine sediment metagenome]|uniref:Uncharacterized protein n=1 Tax=marine sediment metagenome TaxID=412755 RepID=A0A0F9LZV2_9ZZZZ
MVCEHKWEKDEIFEGDGVMLFFGPIGDIKREWRYICQKCGEIKYE